MVDAAPLSAEVRLTVCLVGNTALTREAVCPERRAGRNDRPDRLPGPRSRVLHKAGLRAGLAGFYLSRQQRLASIAKGMPSPLVVF